MGIPNFPAIPGRKDANGVDCSAIGSVNRCKSSIFPSFSWFRSLLLATRFCGDKVTWFVPIRKRVAKPMPRRHTSNLLKLRHELLLVVEEVINFHAHTQVREVEKIGIKQNSAGNKEWSSA